MSLFDFITPAVSLVSALSGDNREKIRALALEVSEPVLRAGLAELKRVLPLDSIANADETEIAAFLRVVAPELSPPQADTKAKLLKRLINEA